MQMSKSNEKFILQLKSLRHSIFQLSSAFRRASVSAGTSFISSDEAINSSGCKPRRWFMTSDGEEEEAVMRFWATLHLVTHLRATHAEKFQLTRLQLCRNAITQQSKSRMKIQCTECWWIKINVKNERKGSTGSRVMADNHENGSSMTWKLRSWQNPNFCFHCLWISVEELLFSKKYLTCAFKMNTNPSCYVIQLARRNNLPPHKKGELLCRTRSSPEKFLRSLPQAPVSQ